MFVPTVRIAGVGQRFPFNEAFAIPIFHGSLQTLHKLSGVVVLPKSAMRRLSASDDQYASPAQV
jgi:hypothetical protein